MKRVQFLRLRSGGRDSDKVYEVELCQLSGSEQKMFVVNFRYGCSGTQLKEGCKTVSPVSLEEGRKIYNSLIVAKINKGYRPLDSAYAGDSTWKEGVSDLAENNAGQTLDSRILTYLDIPPDHWPLSRIIWRAGELAIPEAADKIGKYIDRGDEKIDYCIAWALGRCGGESHVPVVESLLESRSPAVKRMALEAFLAIAPRQRVEQLLAEVKREFPSDLQRWFDREDSQGLSERLLAMMSAAGEESVGLLENLYTLALHSPAAHGAIVRLLRTIPFEQKNHFQAFRHILKRSEFRLDGEVFATIALRIELTRAHRWSRIFSKATKEYLRRRVWRTLRKLGEAQNDKGYVQVAAALLATMLDEHGREPGETIRTRYNWQTRASEVFSVVRTGRFAGFLAFNHILYTHSEQYRLGVSRKFWHQVGDVVDAGRTEAFPELWDKHPDRVLTLLEESRCREVHLFCVKILRENAEFCRLLPVAAVCRLLDSAYEVTVEFALEAAKGLYDPRHPDTDLVAACLAASHAPAREQGRRWLDDQPDLLGKNPAILVTALLSPFSDLRDWLVLHLQRIDLTGGELGVVIEKLIDRALQLTPEERRERLPLVAGLMMAHCQSGLQQLDMSTIGRLVEDDRVELQLLGARLLLQLDIRGEDLPQDYLSRVMDSPDAEVRSVGVSLLGKCDDGFLLERQQLLNAFCLSEHGAIRRAVHPLIKRLAKKSDAYAEALFQDLIQAIFPAEEVEGLHDDIIDLIADALDKPLKTMEKNLRWRLLHSRSRAARRLGAMSLQYTGYGTYSVRQWAGFANNAEKTVRDWAMSAYTAESERIRAEAADSLRILNSDWDDSREFGVDYFRRVFTTEDWRPDLIIGICDSTRDDIQRFGRELITGFFQEDDGEEYLTRLSQHPSRNVQLFTTNFLFSFARDDMEILTQLKPYFLTVLSQVRKGRVAKDRVMKFLTEEALKSEEAARFVGEIFQRQAVTCAIADQAGYIQGMCAICTTYPTVKLPLTINQLPVREKRLRGEDNAV